MVWITLISLLSIGLILVIAEILFVPGTTLVGLLGLIITAVGIYYAFLRFDPQFAWAILALTSIANFAALLYGFRSGVWNKFSLKGTIQSRAFDNRLAGLEVGMSGRSISDIKPYGKGEFFEKMYEVKSDSGFISVGSDIIITKLENNIIIVKT
jgi:membrane-bound ClpP family serine protease